MDRRTERGRQGGGLGHRLPEELEERRCEGDPGRGGTAQDFQNQKRAVRIFLTEERRMPYIGANINKSDIQLCHSSVLILKFLGCPSPPRSESVGKTQF